MKILHLISGGDTGGAKTHVITLLAALIGIGVEAELLCIMEGVFTQEAEQKGIPVKIIPQKRRYDLMVLKKIKKHIENGNYDIVHCHGARANYIALFIKKKLRVPFITTLHSDYKLDFKDNPYKQAVFATINAFALRRFEHILTVTEDFKKMMTQRGFNPERLRVIYNGISFKEAPKFCGKEEFLKRYGLEYDKESIYIGIAARLQIVKGVIYFLEAAKKVAAKNANVEFLVAGSGDLEDDFKSFIKKNKLGERIHLLGFVSDINSFYNVIDINTLTSLSESFPYSLLEGAKMKKATIAAAVGGIPEMIRHNATGLLFNACDTDKLAENMEKLINDSSLRKNFGENFYKEVKENFSAENMALAHKKIYSDIIAQNRK